MVIVIGFKVIGDNFELYNEEVAQSRGSIKCLITNLDDGYVSFSKYNYESINADVKDIRVTLQDTKTKEISVLNFYDFIKLVGEGKVYLTRYRRGLYLSFFVITYSAYILSTYINYVGEEMLETIGEGFVTVFNLDINLTISWEDYVFTTRGLSFSNYFPDFLIQLKQRTTSLFGVLIELDKSSIKFYTFNNRRRVILHTFEITNVEEFKKVFAKAILVG